MGTDQLAPEAGSSDSLPQSAVDERGFMLLEVLIAMFMLTVGITALLAVFVSSALSLHMTAKSGTAVTLAESQMEIYRTVSFTGIRINGSLIPTSGTDPYVTAHSTNANIPPSTGQALAGQNGDDACPSATLPAACYPVQTVTGPDGASYTIDTYVDYINDDSTFSIRTPAAGLTLKLVTVVVRDATTKQLLAEDTSTFHA